MKNSFFSVNSILTFITITAVMGLAYYLLLHDGILRSSISSIISYSSQLTIRQHFIVLGLLPIYIAAMIFGAILLGIYLGSKLERFFQRSFKSE
jgi:hypothetical protein